MSSITMQFNARILVIDDEPFMQAITLNQLRQLGYTDIATAADGADALAILQNAKQSFDLILCDLNMPMMDGFDFIHAAQAIHYEGVLIILSSEDAQQLDEAVALGISCGLNVPGALNKPLDSAALRKMLSSYSAG